MATDVKMLLINTLDEEFHLPVILQGSMSIEDQYPEAFFTFFNNSTTDEAFYNNAESETIWDFDLNYYSKDPASVNSVLLEARNLLKSVGFIPDGSGYDVLSDEQEYTGRGINLLYIERK